MQGGIQMKFISWNVNGLRAVMKKNFMEVFDAFDADFFCLQETKLQAGQIDMPLKEYHQYWNYAEKKGYSGTAIFTKHEPQHVTYGIGQAEHDQEGRVITLEYPNFFVVTCYTPNSQNELKRLDYRMEWEDAFLSYINQLDARKPVILCGDLNVAHQEIDLKNPKNNQKNAGFTIEERQKFTTLLENGYIDTYRALHPEQTGAYSWWSYRFNARKNNAGWRIDYFVISERLRPQLQEANLYPQLLGSDHCPIEATLDLELTP